MYRYIVISAIFLSSAIAKVNVAVSIQPQEYILEQIANNLVNTTVIVAPGSSVHTYEPKPSQMVKLSRSKLYFAIGVEFEDVWLPKFKAQNRNLKIIKTDKNIIKHPITVGEEAGEMDPHIWLSPSNIKIIAKNMTNALINTDKENSKIYTKNLNIFLEKIDNLKKELKKKLSTLNLKKFLTLHPSWGYFAKEFDLEQIAIEVRGKEPSPKELIEIIKLTKKEQVKAIFAQPEFSQKSANLIANELQIKVVKISPLSKNIVKNLTFFTDRLLDK